ncbi:MAG: tetratricopeptide repeat protein [Planctomycetota bacterium]|jgi:tetratricopeptide (TPR) repeat protein
MLRKTIVALIMTMLVVFAGCQTHAENRKAAKERWDKTSARIKLAVAKQEYDSGKYAHAEKNVRECIDADPQMAEAHLLLGKLLLREDKTAEALSALMLAVRLNEKVHEGWYWLGVAAQDNSDYSRAYEYYTKAMALEPTNVDYILAVADVQVARNNYSEAVNLLTRRMEALPRDVSLKVAAADLMLRAGKGDVAIGLYKQAMLMASDSDDIAESLGYCYVFGGKWTEAADVFDRLVENCRDEQRKELYLQVAALCNMNCGRYDRAVSCYGTLSVQERDNAEIWAKMGQAALGAGMNRRALACGQKALSLRPGYADAIALVGCAQYAGGDYAGAARSFEKITVNDKNGGFSLLMQARCYEQLGQRERAERAYETALEMNPNSILGDFLAKGRGVGNQ